MLRTKRQRDQAAFGCIAATPFLVVVIVCSVLFVRWNNPNNPENPNYISPEQRSRTSVASCEASRSSHFAGMQTLALTTTIIFLPLLPSAHYITALGFGGGKNETTTWGVATHAPCTANITGLPEPYMTYTIGPTAAMYTFISTRLSVGCYRSPCKTKHTTSLKTTVHVNCYRTVLSAYTRPYWDEARGKSSTTVEESTGPLMTCTSSWKEDKFVGTPYERSSTIYIKDTLCDYHDYCSQGRVIVTIAGDLAGLTSTFIATVSSSTWTPTSSMVTVTKMSQTNEATNSIVPITVAPPMSSTSGIIAP